MTLKEYLTERLGKKQANAVLRHAKNGEAIIFSGPPATGKFEDWEVYPVTVDKPLEKITPKGFIEANF